MELATVSPYLRHFVFDLDPRLSLFCATSIPGSPLCLPCQEREPEMMMEGRFREVQKIRGEGERREWGEATQRARRRI